MRCCVKVVFEFKQQVHRETSRTSLEYVVQNEIGVVESGIQMRLAGSIETHGIGHSVRGKGARREFR